MANLNNNAIIVPTAPVPEDAAQGDANILSNQVIPGFSNMPVFDIRNGEVTDAKSILVRPTIPSAYHWAPLGGVTPENAMSVVEGFIRCALAQAEDIPATQMDAVKKRKLAIVIGTARAVMTSYYRITTADIIGGELAAVRLNVLGDGQGGFNYVVAVGANDAKRAALVTDLALTEQERSVIAVLAMSAIGVPAMQGWSIIMTGHHYLSEVGNASRKNVAVVEKQFWVSPSVQPWFTPDMADIQDWMWHKSGHPISMSLKVELAYKDAVARMIKEAGAGSAAARLPAQDSEIRAAGSYLTLLETVGALLRQVGGEMDMGVFPDIVFSIKIWQPGMPRPEGEDFNAIIPRDITTRTMAISWLGEVLNRNAGIASWCYGFYCALSDANTSVSGAKDTLKGSFSLNKLKSQSYASYVDGNQSYSDYVAMKSRMRTEGKFSAPKFAFIA